MNKFKLMFLAAVLAAVGLVPLSALAAVQVYNNADYKVSLNYSGLNMQTKPVPTYIPVQNTLHDPNTGNLISLYLKPSIYKGTNLEAAVFSLFASSAVDKTTCYENALAGLTYDHVRKVQGNEWHYAIPNPHGGAAAGHSSSTETYHLYKNNTCYEVILQVSDFSIGNSPVKVWPYSSKRVFNRLGAVFNRLKVK